MMSTSPLINFCRWLSRLVWLNITWVLFTLLGGVVFGFFPATVTMCFIIRQYLNGAEKSTLKTMWTVFKREFLRSNKVGWAVLIPTLSLLWYVNWGIINLSELYSLIAISFFPLTLLLIALIYYLMIQVSIYDTDGIKNNFVSALSLLINDKQTFLMTILVGMILVLFGLFFPIIFLLFGLSPICFCTIALLWLKNSEFQYNAYDS